MRNATEVARCLGQEAEAVCRYYLPNGRRQGRYWIIGDVRNTPGRSMFVRLIGPESGKGAAGKWADYVARRVMLRPCGGRVFCRGSSASTQHNLRPFGRVA